MTPSARVTISVRLTERQLEETIHALEAVLELEAHDAAGLSAITTALERFRAALTELQERTR